jgi:hypothetical protein
MRRAQQFGQSLDQEFDVQVKPGRSRRVYGALALTALLFSSAACASGTSSGSSAPTPTPDSANVADPSTQANDGSAAGSDDANTTDASQSGERNPNDTYGEYGIYERVNFPAGSLGTTVSAGVVRGTVNGYLVRASAGQQMTVEITSENAVFDLYAPDDSLLTGGRYAFVDPLDADGDYLIVVQSEFGNASFDLAIQITATGDPGGAGEQEGAAEASACPAGYTDFNGDFPLRLCHKGETVEVVQERLVALGYNLDVDGYFGASTEEAVADLFGDGVAELFPPDIESLR